jgi:8-oxo-dGTP pyrophosphatase MutT (NUDIX family)
MFNKIHYRTNKKLLDFNNNNIILRNAVRAIIIDKTNKQKILMAHLEKTDEYKFPGGGVHKNERNEEALRREVLEEVGFEVIKINEEMGSITEYDIAKEGENNIFKMISKYYTVEVKNEQKEQMLEEYEKELLFKPCWIEIGEAYKTNKEKMENKHTKTTQGITRETIVLKILKEKYEKGKNCT